MPQYSGTSSDTGVGGVDKINWIRDLVLAEQQMEDSGVVDFTAGFDPGKQLEESTLDFLNDLKAAFVESASAFNQLKGSSLGNLKIYGISKTKADFMLFRNGYKLIFSLQQPGLIQVTYNTVGAHFIPGMNRAEQGHVELLQARWGAFGELAWTYNELPINLDYLVRYYLTKFVRDSAK